MAIILGLDPDINKIPDAYKSTDGSVDVVNWGRDVIHATAADIHGIKFQMAYFEAYGIYGLETLAALVDAGRSIGLKIVMDGKRGDIGSTSAAYAKAYLNPKNYVGDNPFFQTF